ncbi:ROK family protein [Peribacillus loiseleuriae]|uniref:ROK family transcriptional regulator n=1 Tax=Peribacillus loiseleuriae TaxID=1679170 RepID=A0A0K9GSS8_9BACI|nr:ROK family protein [Peribacillus loiseleuriae]KMY49690.1 ROK family transcriptional regulator [Peribacillus loiseleuriae]
MLKQFTGLMSPRMKGLKSIYQLIRKFGPVDKNQLVELSGYKQSTCARLIEELLQANLIYESGLGESSGGRRPSMYVIKPDTYYLIGVDIAGAFTRVILLDLNLTILEVAKLEMSDQYTPDDVLEFIYQKIEQMMRDHHVQTEKLLGIGVGSFGQLDRAKGIILSPERFMSDEWINVNITELLQRRFNTLVILDNGANLAALGEYRSKYWKKVDSLVYTMSGIGIRCGIVSEEKLVGGKVDLEGSFGHIIVDIHGRKCSCGSYGCLNVYCTLPYVQEELIRQLKRGKESIIRDMIINIEDIRLDHILDALDQNDPLCCSIIQDAAYFYGIGLSNLIYLVRPDVVIIGGALASHPIFYEMATKTAKQRVQYYPEFEVEFCTPSTGYNVVAVGAGCMILDYYVETNGEI